MSLARWKNVDTLIIDEGRHYTPPASGHALTGLPVSMIKSDLLDSLSQIGQRLRNNSAPFGGIQVIATGDFYQLPPVPDRDDKPKGVSQSKYQPLFAFEADCWRNLFPSTQIAQLKTVFRQSETSFVSLLTRFRQGLVAESDAALLRTCERPVEYIDGVEPVSLMASKTEAATLNTQRLGALPDEAHIYISRDQAGVNSKGEYIDIARAITILNSQTNWDSKVTLKKGALVMLLANMQVS
jgi:ATP-dependent DNA helicase PIF1